MCLRFFHRQLIIVITVLSGLLFSCNSYAQQFYESNEYGMLIGGSHYFGDLNPDYGLKRPMVAAGVFYRRLLNPYISIRGNLNYSRLSYADELSNNAYQLQRNLSFHSNIVELSLMAEFNFFWFDTGDPRHRFTPYLTGGVGGFYYEPYANYEGNNYKLRLLGTEGQYTEAFKDRKYSPISVCFPVGAGFKYWIKPGVNLGFEIASRFTMTDYLDDVSTTYIGIENFGYDPMHPTAAAALQDRSIGNEGEKLGRIGKQRGDSHSKDHYVFAQVSLSFQLKTYKCPSRFNGMWEE